MSLRSGVARMLLASLFFAGMAAFIKEAAAGGIPTAEIVFARCFLSLPGLVFLLRRDGISVVPNNWALVLVRSTFGTIAMGLSFYAIGQLHLGDSQMLNQAQPVFVALLAPWLLGERVSPLTALSVVVSLVGTALILRPSVEVGNLAGIAMLVSAFSSSCAVVSVRRLSASEHPTVIVTGFAAFTSLAALPFCLADFVVPTPGMFLVLLGAATCAMLGQLFMTQAYAVESAAVVAAASYVTVPTSVLIGYLAWGERPASGSWVGGCLVLASGLALVWSRRRVRPRGFVPVAKAAPVAGEVL